jgi:hypothetical protein
LGQKLVRLPSQSISWEWCVAPVISAT